MRHFAKGLGLGLLCTLSLGTASAEQSLVSDGHIKVTKEDVSRLVSLQVSEPKIEAFFQDEKAVRDAIASLYMTRRIASDARDEGLGAEGEWVESYFKDLGLRRLQIQRVVERAVEDSDLEALAKEEYLANPERFVRPEQVRVSHILISTEEHREAQADSRANDLMAELRKNPNQFSELVEKHSDDEASTQKDGDLGFFARDQMVKPFEEAAFGLKEPGELAGPVKTRFGYHIIRFEERREESKRPFEEVKPRLVEQARGKVQNRAKEAYLAKLRSAEDIESDQEAIEALVQPLPDPEELLEREEASSAVE